jgi:hypothetical protein
MDRGDIVVGFELGGLFPGLRRENEASQPRGPCVEIFLSLIFLSFPLFNPDTLDRKILDRKISNIRAAPGF